MHSKTRTYDVSLNGKWFDRVFYTLPEGYRTVEEREESVKASLVDHDGYAYRISVREIKVK